MKSINMVMRSLFRCVRFDSEKSTNDCSGPHINRRNEKCVAYSIAAVPHQRGSPCLPPPPSCPPFCKGSKTRANDYPQIGRVQL